MQTISTCISLYTAQNTNLKEDLGNTSNLGGGQKKIMPILNNACLACPDKMPQVKYVLLFKLLINSQSNLLSYSSKSTYLLCCSLLCFVWTVQIGSLRRYCRIREITEKTLSQILNYIFRYCKTQNLLKYSTRCSLTFNQSHTVSLISTICCFALSYEAQDVNSEFLHPFRPPGVLKNIFYFLQLM